MKDKTSKIIYTIFFGILWFAILFMFFKFLVLAPLGSSLRILNEKKALNNVNEITSFQDGDTVALCGTLQSLNGDMIKTPFTEGYSFYYVYSIQHTEFSRDSEGGRNEREIVDYSGFGYVPYGINVNGEFVKIKAVPRVYNSNLKRYYAQDEDIYSRAVSYIQNERQSPDNASSISGRIHTIIESKIDGYDSNVIYDTGINNQTVEKIDEMYIPLSSQACAFGVWDNNTNELNKPEDSDFASITLGIQSDSEKVLNEKLKDSSVMIFVFTVFIVFMSFFFIGIAKRSIKRDGVVPIISESQKLS